MSAKLLLLVAMSFYFSACSSSFEALPIVGSANQAKLISSSPTGNHLCDIANLSRTATDSAPAIQQCINETPTGSTLVIPAGRYRIMNQVTVDHGIAITTLNSTGAGCDVGDNHICAEFFADPNLHAKAGMIRLVGDGITLDHVVINGNKAEVASGPSAQSCRNGDNSYGYNFFVAGNNITITYSVFKNAICATGLALGGSGLYIVNNIVANNGVHNVNQMWSDGITAGDMQNSTVSNNLIMDNTDVDFILGGCSNCKIQNNQIVHSNNFASSSFAGLMVHAWPNGATSGNYTGTDISGNSVNCTAAHRCGIGLYLGASAWYNANIFGGNVHDNSIYGAEQGFAVDKVQGFHIANNQVDGSGGSFLASCGQKNYSAFVITPGTQVDRSGDGIADFNYASFTMDACVPNWYTQDPSAGSTALSAPVNIPTPIAPQNQPDLTGIQQFVSKLYQGLLQRPADPGGLAQWTQTTINLRDCSAVARGFFYSDEYAPRRNGNSDTDVIIDLYRGVLGREPSWDEVMSWANALPNYDRQWMLEGFLASGEFQTYCANSGTVWVNSAPPDQSQQRNFIRSLYQGILQRPADSAGLQWWTAQAIAINDCSAVGRGFALSAEYAGRRASIDSVQIAHDMYLGLLGRAGSDGEANAWAQEINSSGFQNVVEGFLSSSEYGARCAAHGLNWIAPAPVATAPTPKAPAPVATPSLSPAENFINSLYVGFLQRPADPGGLANWINISRAQGCASAAAGIAFSQEYANRRANISVSQLVVDMYGAMLGRTPDAGEISEWSQNIQRIGFEASVEAIAGSAEYAGRCQAAGL